MVRSQISTLTPDPSFGHNLCFNYSNGSCKSILNIYISRAFQWYKEIFNPMNFDPWNCSMKIRNSIGTPIPKMGVHFGVCELIPSNSLAFSTCTFSCLCFSREPKVKVVTNSFMFISLLLLHLQIPSHVFHFKRKYLNMLQNTIQQSFSKEDNKVQLKS